jgi:dTDP-4-amino-4,6-dideoxygalactose transaminase
MAFYKLPPSGNAVSASFLLGAGTRDFAGGFASHSGFPRDHILFTDSGAAALYVALRGLAALSPDRKAVALPAWCCPSVPQTVIQAGLVPVPVDVDPSTLGYDTSALLEAKSAAAASVPGSGGLLAVVLVHFFGQAQPMPAGDWSGTAFLRDCAQDFDHRADPGEGAACFYSFGRGKALNAGHGGALCLPSEVSGPQGSGNAQEPFAAACRAAWDALPESPANPMPKALAINLLSEPRVFWALAGMPFLGIGACLWKAPLSFAKLSPRFDRLGTACLEAYRQRRAFYRRLTAKYRSLILACDGDWIHGPGLGLPHAELPTRFPIMVRDRSLRETLFREMNSRFGGVTRMYPQPLPSLPGAPDGFGRDAALQGFFPGAKRVAAEILTLPVTAELIGREDRYVDFLAGILERYGALRHPRRVPSVPRSFLIRFMNRKSGLPSWLPSGP